MSNYITLNRISVKKANANSAWWVGNSVSMIGLFGFVHHMSRELDFSVKKFGLVVHDINMHGLNCPNESSITKSRDTIGVDMPKPTSPMLSSTKKPKGSPAAQSMQPSALMDMTISVIIECDEDEIYPRDLENFMNSSKILGGYVADYQKLSDYMQHSQKDIIKSIGSGFFVTNAEKFVDLDHKLTSMMTLASLRGIKNNFFMTSLGYQQITELVSGKVGVRDDVDKHAFVEPMVGLCEYINIRNEGVFDKGLPLWEYSVEDGKYLLHSDNSNFSEISLYK